MMIHSGFRLNQHNILVLSDSCERSKHLGTRQLSCCQSGYTLFERAKAAEKNHMTLRLKDIYDVGAEVVLMLLLEPR
jgi:hypothetical protein